MKTLPIRRIAWSCAVAAALLGHPAVAGAQEDKAAQVSRLNDEGSAFYKARDYKHAIEKFAEAYAIDPDPNLLFNIARSYELLGDTDLAIEKYEAYLSKPGGDAKGRQKAEDSLATLRKIKAGAGRGATGSQEPNRSSSSTDDGAHAPAGGSGLRVAGLVMAGIGLVGVGIGTGFGLSARTKNDEARDLCPQDQCTTARGVDLTKSARDAATVSTVGFVAGGALLVGGLVMFMVAPRSPARVSVGFAPAEGGGRFALAGKF